MRSRRMERSGSAERVEEACRRWREMGYEVMATADHGMNAEHHHGGMEKIMRDNGAKLLQL